MSGTLRDDDPWSVSPGSNKSGQFHNPEGLGGSSHGEPGDRSNDEVDDAYRVAAENMREGQRRAGPRNQRGFDWRSQGYGSEYDPRFGYKSSGYGSPFGYGSQGYNSPFGYRYGGRSPDGLLEQIMRTYMDMMGVVGTMVNGLGRPPYASYRRPSEYRRDPDFRYEDAVQRGRSAAVRVEVRSNQTNQVELNLEALRRGVSLSVPPLRSLNNGKPKLHDISIQTENDRYVLRIHIPDKQPEGLYSGEIVDARTGEPCGTLAIQVGRSSPERGRHRPIKKL